MRRGGQLLHGGFSLLELLIVVVILGVLAAIIVPRFVVSADEAKKSACAENVANLNALIEKWHFEKGTWPAVNLSDMEADPAYLPAGIPRCPITGGKYTLDAANRRVSGHDH